ncbi:MAG: 3'-5' exoribonuclease [Candidatus Thiodiazotropha lotti]|nr:3'-5' exoribonuclease [Candidatus Thiodiazotropha lotti]MCW4188297.1 3'-5' exoribonuclease [Candidatus Thiodiazotropha lotti]
MNQTMIDLESWGTDRASVIRALVMVQFSETQIGNVLYIDARNSIDDQLEKNRKIHRGTQCWWLDQRTSLSEMIEASQNQIIYCNSTEDITNQITDFYFKHSPEFIWTRRSMDIHIIKDLLSTFGKNTPWKYSQEYDCSAFDILLPKPQSIRPHDPFFDCISQIQHVQAAIKMAPLLDN